MGLRSAALVSGSNNMRQAAICRSVQSMEPAIDIRVHRIGRLRYRRHRALGQSLPAHSAAYSILYWKYQWQPIRTFTRTRLRSEAWRCTRSSFLQKLAQHSEPSVSFR